jgi:hypothetical protein
VLTDDSLGAPVELGAVFLRRTCTERSTTSYVRLTLTSEPRNPGGEDAAPSPIRTFR